MPHKKLGHTGRAVRYVQGGEAFPKLWYILRGMKQL
jgi:hypothetical protein